MNERRREPTARTRELGAQLKERREAARWSTAELARQLGWSPTKVSRLESGERRASEVDVAVYLSQCGVLREELSCLLDLCRLEDDGYWLQRHGDRLPDELRTLIYQENIATAIESYEPLLIPGLTQRPTYARALFRWGKLIPETLVEPRVRTRMERQALTKHRYPPRLTFFVHEQALRSVVGDRSLMNEQLLHLVFLTSRPQFEIRVVPTDAGPTGVLGGPFCVRRFAGHGPVVHLEGLTSSEFVEDRSAVTTFQAVLNRLGEVALSGGQSRDFLAQLASDYERPDPDPGRTKAQAEQRRELYYQP